MSIHKPITFTDETAVDNTALHYRDLIQLFDNAFFAAYNTRLIKGGDEPIYLPSNELTAFNQIVFAHGYFASALHEISHWCLAGASRRLLEDYGYWYVPDGRDHEQQAKFESVEIKPQAIEWALCAATGKDFDVSTDNLLGEGETDRIAFKAKVYQQVLRYLDIGFPKDAATFITVLATHYQTPLTLVPEHFYYS
ncbi:elongation factor P hydroxylase [Cognaticolwellia beringensis]|uniref:Elongation factor P hydroxylase n=1 Tax=Cognaticolwellia beringensis TaxID=1967665 RepID=A0A222G9N2_9GAMM|nr:elongation factor P hydroxylase [Cognaticolwellia beringensis]ASP48608.1 elongation factor P hydroxylase [Cognaticolwellia beringensis]